MSVRASRAGWSVVLALTAAISGVAAAAQEVPAGYRFPTLALPEPGGSYPIGTRRFEVSRDDGKPLHVVAWYPAKTAGGPTAAYLDSEEQRIEGPAIARNFRWPAAILDAVAVSPTHAREGVAPARGRFPLLIFSHGYFLYPRQNTALMEHLASRGYVVLSLGHPGDAADLPGSSGIVPTDLSELWQGVDKTRLLAFWTAADDTSLKAALPGFFVAQRDSRMQKSLTVWRTDIMALADAAIGRRFALARTIDPKRIAYGGMSFGGSASVSACQSDRRCSAAFNLDGFEFDARLYDRAVRMPLLLIQSDWRAFPNFGAPDSGFTHYDYAYEPWSRAGQAGDVYRFLLNGTRHLALTDLALAPADPVRERVFGPAAGARVIDAINGLVAAFLDGHLRHGRINVYATASRFPIVETRRAVVPQP